MSVATKINHKLCTELNCTHYSENVEVLLKGTTIFKEQMSPDNGIRSIFRIRIYRSLHPPEKCLFVLWKSGRNAIVNKRNKSEQERYMKKGKSEIRSKGETEKEKEENIPLNRQFYNHCPKRRPNMNVYDGPYRIASISFDCQVEHKY